MATEYSGFTAKFKSLSYRENVTFPSFFHQCFIDNRGTSIVLIKVSGLEIELNPNDSLTIPDTLNPLIQIKDDFDLQFNEDGDNLLNVHFTRLEPSIITY